MADGISVGGLASGIDTNSIIDGLTDLEMVRVTREEDKKKDLEDKKKAYDDLFTRVSGLASTAEGLSDPEAFNLYKSTSDDDEILTISGDEDAVPGSFDVEIKQLAENQKVASKGFNSFVSALGISGSFTLSRNAEAIEDNPIKTETEINIQSGDTLKDVMNKINAAEGTGVQASILTLGEGDNRLVLTAVDQGTKGFQLNEKSGNLLSSGLGLIQDNQTVQSEFGLILEDGSGPAELTTTIDQLKSGIGGNNLDDGDQIHLTGTGTDGSAIDTQINLFAGGVARSIGDILGDVETAFGGTVSASLNGSGEIVLKDTAGGVDTLDFSMEFTDQGNTSNFSLGSSYAVNTFSNVLNEGQNAFYTVDNIAMSSQGNKADNLVRGVTFNLLKTTEPDEPIHVSLERDMGGLKEKIQGLVDSYNSLMKFIDNKSEVKSEGDEKTGADKKEEVSAGILTGDSLARRVRNEVQLLMTSPIKELKDITQYTSLASIGIKSSRYSGQLEVDSDDLEKALATDFEGVRSLFAATGRSDNPNFELGRHTEDTQTGTYFIDADNDIFDQTASGTNDGSLGNRIGQVLSSKEGDSKGLSIKAPSGTGSGNFTFVRGLASQLKIYHDQADDYVDGFFKQTRQSMDRQIRMQEERIDEMAQRVENYRSRLTKQFSAMELAMSELQQQSSTFLAQVGSF